MWHRSQYLDPSVENAQWYIYFWNIYQIYFASFYLLVVKTDLNLKYCFSIIDNGTTFSNKAFVIHYVRNISKNTIVSTSSRGDQKVLMKLVNALHICLSLPQRYLPFFIPTTTWNEVLISFLYAPKEICVWDKITLPRDNFLTFDMSSIRIIRSKVFYDSEVPDKNFPSSQQYPRYPILTSVSSLIW